MIEDSFYYVRSDVGKCKVDSDRLGKSGKKYTFYDFKDIEKIFSIIPSSMLDTA